LTRKYIYFIHMNVIHVNSAINLGFYMEAASPSSEPAETLSERARLAIERAILAGELRPGARLAIADLSKSFAVSATPLREALSRLVSRGLVMAIGQRGFRVAPISREDLADITVTRTAIELDALRRAMRRGDGRWEGEIVSALHQMKRIVKPGSVIDSSPELEAIHKAFHTNLIAACGSNRMRELASLLYDQAFRYRRMMLTAAIGADEFIAEHEQLSSLALARSDGAIAFLERHLARTYQTIFGELPAVASARGSRLQSPQPLAHQGPSAHDCM